MRVASSIRPLSPLILFILCAVFPAHAEPLTIHDDLGRTHVFPQPPRRIVSISPGLTETLFALGLGDAVVGVSDFCDFPEAARAKPKVGGVSPNIEVIVGLRPDLVLGTGGIGMREFAARMDRLGIPALGFEPTSIDAVFDRILRLGAITDRRPQAQKLVEGLQDRLDTVTSRRPTGSSPRVLYLVDEDPYITVGRGSFLYDVLIKAGGRPFDGGTTGYPRIGMEAIVGFDPEVIFFADDTPDGGERRLTTWRRWKTISAVRSGRLYAILRGLVNRPGPRIVDAVEVIADKLHLSPDVFHPPFEKGGQGGISQPGGSSP
ncbi:MAG: cobalamin-binding protein [Nitrospirae bacterium]|nr:cobalamin-binding protein [Nitrospirota bacterium]